MTSMESAITDLIAWLELIVELLGAAIVGVGIMVTLVQLTVGRLGHHRVTFQSVRLGLSHYLVMALEFQLAADILGTAVSPTWPALGKLAATAVIRTMLAYFLSREVKEIESSGTVS